MQHEQADPTDGMDRVLVRVMTRLGDLGRNVVDRDNAVNQHDHHEKTASQARNSSGMDLSCTFAPEGLATNQCNDDVPTAPRATNAGRVCAVGHWHMRAISQGLSAIRRVR
jgi:hypothetical protein